MRLLDAPQLAFDYPSLAALRMTANNWAGHARDIVATVFGVCSAKVLTSLYLSISTLIFTMSDISLTGELPRDL